MECPFDEWRKIKDVLILMKLRKDYLLIEKHLQKCYYQKRAWRNIKSRVTGEIYNVQILKEKNSLVGDAGTGSVENLSKVEDSPSGDTVKV